MIQRLQHYGVTVSDHRSSGRFYSKVIGIPRMGSVVQKPKRSLIGRHLGAPTVRITWHQRGYDSIELFSFPEIEQEPFQKARRYFTNVGPARLSFRVASLKHFESRLSARNLEFKKVTDPWGEKFLSIADPDMIPLAVYGGAKKGVELGYATMTVSSLDKSVAFYGVVLGLPQVSAGRLALAKEIFPESHHDGSVRVARVGIDGNGVELVEFPGVDRSSEQVWFPDPVTPYDVRYTEVGIKHVCFQATQTRRWVRKLQVEGVRVIMGPAREPSGLWVTYLLDPDGVVVELYDLPPALTKMMRGVSLFWARFLSRRA